MDAFDPVKHVFNSHVILDHGEWPNFHDAEVHYLHIWRGDVRPDEHVWMGPVIEATFELCALETPYLVVLKFHDCESIRLTEFNRQNAVYDLTFMREHRGYLNNGDPLTPFICVKFEEVFGVALSFKCLGVQAVERREIEETR